MIPRGGYFCLYSWIFLLVQLDIFFPIVDISFFYLGNVAPIGGNSFSHTWIYFIFSYKWIFFPLGGYFSFFAIVSVVFFLSLLPGHNNRDPDLDNGMSTTACTVLTNQVH